MSWHLASGFILGVGIASVVYFIGLEMGMRKTNKDEDCILYLLEKQIEKENIINDLIEENKSYKKAYDNFNEERNSDYWG